MPASTVTRRDWMRSSLTGGPAAFAALAALESDNRSLAADEKPSELTITAVETFSLLHKLPRAIGPSTALAPRRDALLVKITTDSGLVGWGETADVGGTRGIIEDHLKPMLLGKNPLQHRKLWRQLWGPNFGDGRAVAGCDVALADVRG